MTKPNEPLSQPAPSPAIDDATMDDAIAWYLKLKDASVTQHDQQAFNAWLQQSPLHHFAYQEAKQLWQDIEAPIRLFHLQQSATPSNRRNERPWGWAVAALCMLGLLLNLELWREPANWDRLTADAVTTPGQMKQLLLADGSSLLLDGNSALDIEFDETYRGLTLRRGRLWVDVTQDAQRPFTITAGEASIKVIGTHFAVMHSTDSVTVTVAEGQVAITDSQGHQALLGGGKQVALINGELGPVSPVALPVALGWKEGRVVFDDAGMSEIVAQLERMLPGRLLLDTHAFSDVRLSGSFPVDQPEALLSALTHVSDIEVHRLPGDLLWLRTG